MKHKKNPVLKAAILLLILELVVLSSGIIILNLSGASFLFGELVLLSLIFAFLVMLVLIIFFRGETKETSSRSLHSLVSVSLKFLLELILVFLWFFVAKKTSMSSVILFFVIYLTFTLFYVIIIIKTLKNKTL